MEKRNAAVKYRWVYVLFSASSQASRMYTELPVFSARKYSPLSGKERITAMVAKRNAVSSLARILYR